MSPFVYARILVIAILLTATAAFSQAVAQPVAPDGSWKPAADPKQTTVIDVNMVWPWMYLDFLPGENFVIEENIKRLSGPETPLRPEDFVPQKGVPILVRIPMETGESVYEKAGKKITLNVGEDKDQPFLYDVRVTNGEAPAVRGEDQRGSTKPARTVQMAVELPLAGAVEQVAGPRTAMLTRPDKAGKTWAQIPDQVCTLVFEDKPKTRRVVLRVWEDKEHRYFVSTRGNDANPGTEERPFRTIQHAAKTVMANDRKGDIYIAGGDYMEEGGVRVTDYVSLYGGFDEAGWRRDPAITASVLLPHGFRDDWLDDMSDRFKDLRRPEHRYSETRIRRKWTGHSQAAVSVGLNSGPSSEQGSPDTFIDGISVFGCDAVGLYQPSHLVQLGGRTIRNCMVVAFHLNAHATTPLTQSGGSRGHFVGNNIGWSTVLSKDNDHPRAQMQYGGGHFFRNLIVFPTGGDYTRMFLMWGNGGLIEGNQLHAGRSFGFTRLTAVKAGVPQPDKPGDGWDIAKIWIFRDNLIFGPDHLGYHASGIPDPEAGEVCGKGLVFEGNTAYCRKSGFQQWLRMTYRCTIRNNAFHVTPEARPLALPPMDKITVKEGKPIVENNRIIEEKEIPWRPADLVDLPALAEAIKAGGDAATLPATDPAKGLKAEPAGPGAVKLSWQPSADPAVTGYIIRHGPRSNSWLNPIMAGNANSAEVKGLKPGTYYFTVAAHKAGYVESWLLSNEVMIEVK